jgi:hypothetical protein
MIQLKKIKNIISKTRLSKTLRIIFNLNESIAGHKLFDGLNFKELPTDIGVSFRDGETPIYTQKWVHYIPIYEKIFLEYKSKSQIKLVEYGVAKGGSLEMWKNFFPKDAEIWGVDINVEKGTGVNASDEFPKVVNGDCTNQHFLNSFFLEMGAPDIIIDDASHIMKDIKKSLLLSFPKLAPGGMYIIEDLHCAYWRKYGGGYRVKDNFFNYVRELIDDLHSEYHQRTRKYPEMSRLKSIVILDSMVILNSH